MPQPAEGQARRSDHSTAAEPRRRPPVAITIDSPTRARISDEIRTLLDRAEALIDFLNAADAPLLDLEPDADGEAEPDEASAQPVTLAPTWAPPVTIHRPTRAEMRAAYRRNGDPVPANLRSLLGRFVA
ncbi:hypothetical protein J8J14_18130 [Roseomonas sp. SSH11]|uniref:Uncharacterized protein n=1 Tax=Pararoseomonas baculiformis TaxID=2820812 RepID=A0ABS4AI37_9PROT|nr:hypothetical protein [Pararoseomonas baculiformis]MBP0446698.1 hypothetical protein [Pararoseomonas baculiformis]